MNISKIGMNATTFGIDPRPTYSLTVEDVNTTETKAPRISKFEEEDVFIAKARPQDKRIEYTFKKDRLSRNTLNNFERGCVIYTGKTDIILKKDAQKAQLLKEIDAQDDIVCCKMTNNKRFGKGVSYRLMNVPVNGENTTSLIYVKKFDLDFNKKAKDSKDVEVIQINDSFKNFIKAVIEREDKLGQVTIISDNK